MASSALKKRCADAVLDLNHRLGNTETGSLIQVWLPEICNGGGVVLGTQNLPYAITGVGDLLALFRCISCRYHFSTDVMKPRLLGAVGRVYATLEPEMCSDVQRYQKQIYLRVSEAQRCRVHSTLVMPVFDTPAREKAVGVFEVVKNAKNVSFDELVDQLANSLAKVNLYAPEVTVSTLEIGLRSWPLDVDVTFLEFDRGAPQLEEKEEEVTGATTSSETEKGKPSDDNDTADDIESAAEANGETGGNVSSGGREGVATNANIELPLASASASLPRAFSESSIITQPVVQQGLGSFPLPPPAVPSPQILAPPTPVNATAEMSGQFALPNPPAPPTSVSPMPPGPSPSFGMPLNVGGQMPGLIGMAQMNPNFLPSMTPTLGNVALGLPSNTPNQYIDPHSLQILIDSWHGPRRRRSERKKAQMGSGKHLTFEDLKAQFGVGLKEAAANLRICPTTLKRACRRNGIARWPCRQLAKLNKTMCEMGYKGSPPKALLQSAMTGRLKASSLSKGLSAAGIGATGSDDRVKTPEGSSPGASQGAQGEDEQAGVKFEQGQSTPQSFGSGRAGSSDAVPMRKPFNSAPASLGLLESVEEDIQGLGLGSTPSTKGLLSSVSEEQEELDDTILSSFLRSTSLPRVASAPIVSEVSNSGIPFSSFAHDFPELGPSTLQSIVEEMPSRCKPSIPSTSSQLPEIADLGSGLNAGVPFPDNLLDLSGVDLDAEMADFMKEKEDGQQQRV